MKQPTLICVCMLLFAPTLFAQNNSTRELLRGISAVPVLVNVSDGSGTTSSLLQSYVELQLRKAGIRVPSDNQRTKKDGYAFLSVRVISSNHEISLVEVSLLQLVNLNRDLTLKATVSTWENRSWGGDRASTDANIKRAVSDFLDDFINDYLAVNSK